MVVRRNFNLRDCRASLNADSSPLIATASCSIFESMISPMSDLIEKSSVRREEIALRMTELPASGASSLGATSTLEPENVVAWSRVFRDFQVKS